MINEPKGILVELSTVLEVVPTTTLNLPAVPSSSTVSLHTVSAWRESTSAEKASTVPVATPAVTGRSIHDTQPALSSKRTGPKLRLVMEVSPP